MPRSAKKASLLLFCMLCLFLQSAAVAAGNRSISTAQWQELTADKAFNYKNDVEKVEAPKNIEPNYLAKFLKGFFGFFGSGLGNLLIWLLLICIVVYVIYRLFFSSDSFLFGKNRQMMKTAGAPAQDSEDIAATDWETLLQNAVGKNDLRLAVRYSYMWLLQMLQHRGLIQYRTDKTNYEYYTELGETRYKQAFRQLSRQYEYTWYGRFAIPADKYTEYISLFDQLKKQLG